MSGVVIVRRNIDPNGVLETALGLSAGTLNAWLTRAELNLLFDSLLIFTTPNDGLKYLDVIYDLGTSLTQAEIDKLTAYVRRSL